MSLVDERTLAAYAAGALEPGLELEVRERLAADPLLRERAAKLEALRAQADMVSRAWEVPPPGVPVGMRPFAAHVQQAYVKGTMGPTPLQPGDRFAVVLDALADADQLYLAVLLYGPGGWNVVFPGRPAEVTALSALPLVEPAGREGVQKRRLELVAQRRPGRQRWAVALVPMAMAPDWSERDPARRWATLKEAIDDREVAVTTVEIEVG